eukprot:9395421-Lingulodinium_polyedra.AAC.1
MVAAVGMLVLMAPGGGGHGGAPAATTRRPPVCGPSVGESYMFRHWARDIAFWSLSTDILPEKQAPAVIL